jgi:hypothetical protein
MMKRFPLLAVAVFCLLFSVFSAGEARAQGVRVKLPAWREFVLLDSMRQDHKINAPPEMVYQAVLQAYKDLGIPTGNTDGKSGIVGSERFERMRTLAGAPMSLSFNCGEGAAGPYADFFRLTVAIVTWVTPRDEGKFTTLGLAAAAAGEDITGTRRNPRECGSLGRVEGKVLERVQAIVGGR